MNEIYNKPESRVKHISAVQWMGDIESEEEIKSFAGENVKFDDDPSPDYCSVLSDGKWLKCDLLQWVVRDDKGNFSRCKF
jgi:hypothetical protein